MSSAGAGAECHFNSCCVEQSYYAVAVAGCTYINGSNLRKAALTLQLPQLAAGGKLHGH